MLDQLLLSTARASAPATATATATTATTCVMIVMVMVVIMVRISLLFRLSFCNKHNFLKSDWLSQFLLNPTVLTLEALRGGGGGGGDQEDQSDPLDIFGFNFLLLDRLSKALVKLFFVCQHIF